MRAGSSNLRPREQEAEVIVDVVEEFAGLQPVLQATEVERRVRQDHLRQREIPFAETDVVEICLFQRKLRQSRTMGAAPDGDGSSVSSATESVNSVRPSGVPGSGGLTAEKRTGWDACRYAKP